MQNDRAKIKNDPFLLIPLLALARYKINGYRQESGYSVISNARREEVIISGYLPLNIGFRFVKKASTASA